MRTPQLTCWGKQHLRIGLHTIPTSDSVILHIGVLFIGLRSEIRMWFSCRICRQNWIELNRIRPRFSISVFLASFSPLAHESRAAISDFLAAFSESSFPSSLAMSVIRACVDYREFVIYSCTSHHIWQQWATDIRGHFQDNKIGLHKIWAFQSEARFCARTLLKILRQLGRNTETQLDKMKSQPYLAFNLRACSRSYHDVRVSTCVLCSLNPLGNITLIMT